MKFFSDCKTAEEAKTVYRKLAKCLHPDKGGTTELMTELQKQYEKWKIPSDEVGINQHGNIYDSAPNYGFRSYRPTNDNFGFYRTNPLHEYESRIKNLEERLMAKTIEHSTLFWENRRLKEVVVKQEQDIISRTVAQDMLSGCYRDLQKTVNKLDKENNDLVSEIAVLTVKVEEYEKNIRKLKRRSKSWYETIFGTE